MLWRVAVICLAGASVLMGQDEDYRVYTDAPRLLLTPQRLRLVKRENERQSLRWQQFDTLMSGGAAMPEPGFAGALYYRTSGRAPVGQQAVEWALSNAATDLRQLALVFDWCGPVMNEAQAERLGVKLEKALAVAPSADVRQQSARALAAIALANRLPDHGEAVLKPIVETWWRAGVAKKLKTGIGAIPREQTYALFELLHATRDNLKIDLREDAPGFFKALPVDHVVSHYPNPYPAPENLYRIPVYIREGEPDLTEAALSRAAELAMVAYDSNAGDNQFLQGWLMQDRYLMRGGFGIPYEFLWANPYQPGLSYFQLPLVFHNAAMGHFFARTSWDEDAVWLGYFEGQLQLFREGKIQTLRAGATTRPISVGDAVILTAQDKENARFRASSEAVFILNLTPHAHYDVEIDDQELRDEETDAGGTLVLALPEGIETGIRVKRRSE